jgi:hypothetical protein
MNKKRIATIAAAGVAALGLAVGTTSIAMADVQANGSDTGLYLFDNDAAAFVSNGTTLHWDNDILVSPSDTDPFATLQCPADSTGWATFITTPGTERTPSAWKAWNATVGHNSTKTLLGVDISPIYQTSGATAPIKSGGGNYSFGAACMKDNNVNLASSGVWYFSAHITAGTGDYTFDPATTTGPVTPPSGSGSIDIQATTVAAQDGVLSLVVPANAKATLGTATLVNQLSTSTGTLPTFQVSDQRVVSAPGWDLTASTAPFVNASDATKTIDPKQLGVKPAIVGTANNVVAGAEHVAGDSTAFSGFASAAAGSGLGSTSLNAALTLVAPANTPAGTYNSTMTLTLTSK